MKRLINTVINTVICAIITFSVSFNSIVLPVNTGMGIGINGQEATENTNTNTENTNTNVVSPKKQQTAIVVAHGYGGKATGCPEYYGKYNMFPGCIITSFDFPDSPKLNDGKVNDHKTYFAQEPELKILKENFEAQKAQGHKVVLMGISRGAMCVVSGNCDGASGIIAESPGADLKDVIDHKCKQFGFGWVPFLGRFVHRWFIRPLRFKNYDPTGPKPIEMVKNIPLDVPIFIIYIKNDNLIPASSSVKIAEELVRNGHKEVYLYGTDFGYHAHILGRDKNYNKIANAFLNKCGVLDASYDCSEGQKLLEDCKISSLDQVVSLRKHLESANWKRYCVRNLAVFATCACAIAVLNNGFLKKKVTTFINKLFTNISGSGIFGVACKKFAGIGRPVAGL